MKIAQNLYRGLLSGFLLLWGHGALAQDDPPMYHTAASECGACHGEIFKQWQGSMHGRSSALNDPIHGAMYKMMVGDPGQEGLVDKSTGKYPACLQCHAPNAARDGKTKLDALPAYGEGVNCVACHTISRFQGVKNPDGKLRVGVNAYEFAPEGLTGGNGAWQGEQPTAAPGSGTTELTANPNRHTANPGLFKSSAICLGCHEQLANPHGVAICTIGDLISQEGSKPSCQSCHMPVVDGMVSHALGGGHDPGMLRRGVTMTLTGQKEAAGVVATVHLENMLLHTYPTGAPFRNVVLKVTALNSAGQVVWQNFAKNPMAEDPQAVLMLKLTDDAGQPIMPMMATKIAGDSRLQPGEKRSLSYTIPAGEVALVRAELLYNLVSKLLVEKIGDQLPEADKKPVVVSRTEFKP